MGDVHVRRQSGFDKLDVDGDDDAHDGGGADGAQHLSRKEYQATQRRQVTREDQTESDGRVEQAAADTVQYPGGDQQTEAVADGDEHDGLVGVSAAGCGLWSEAHAHCVDEVAREEEEKGSDEFTGSGDEVLVRGRPVVIGVRADVPKHGLVQYVGHVGWYVSDLSGVTRPVNRARNVLRVCEAKRQKPIYNRKEEGVVR